MDSKALKFEAVRLLTKIQTQCSILFAELQDDHHVVELGKENFQLTDGEAIKSIFLSDDRQLIIETEIECDGEKWEYDFLTVCDITTSLKMLESLENIKTNRKVSAN